MVHKEILYVTAIVVIGHCFCIGIAAADVVNDAIRSGDGDSGGGGGDGGDGTTSYDFKNKEILQQNEIPELSLIMPIIEQQHHGLKGFINAWDAIDHERLIVSAGES